MVQSHTTRLLREKVAQLIEQWKDDLAAGPVDEQISKVAYSKGVIAGMRDVLMELDLIERGD